jgi:hypothetical protein
MSSGKITYLLGAGASANAIPVLAKFKDGVRSTIEILNWWWSRPAQLAYRDSAQSGNYKKAKDALTKLEKVCEEHTTVDTHCRMLKLTGSDSTQIKNALSLFFQLSFVRPRLKELDSEVSDFSSLDLRYDSFFASILEGTWHSLPRQINVLSWNYDDQFERAYRRYMHAAGVTSDLELGLNVFSKFSNDRQVLNFDQHSFFIYKINGTASFRTSDGKMWTAGSTTELNRIEDVLKAFAMANDADINVRNHVSFSWDEEDRNDELYKKVLSGLNLTETLVIIGYSFPFFNRNIDMELLKHMPKLKTIVVQDPHMSNGKSVIERLQQRLGKNREVVFQEPSVMPNSIEGIFYESGGDFHIPNSFG